MYEATKVNMDMCSSGADENGYGTYSLRTKTEISSDGTTKELERCTGKHRGHVTVLK